MPPVMHEKLERLRGIGRPKRPCKKKERFGCGKRFPVRAQDFDLSPGAMLTRNCESDFRQLVAPRTPRLVRESTLR